MSALVPVDHNGAAEPPPETLARVFAPRGTRLHFAWGVGPQIRVCPVGAPPPPFAGGGAATGSGGGGAASSPAPPPLLSYGGGATSSPQMQARPQAAAPQGPCVLTTVAWSTPSMEQRRVAYDVLPLYRQIRRALLSLDASAAAAAAGTATAAGASGRSPAAPPPPTGALALRRRDALCAYARAVRRVLESARPEPPVVSVGGQGGDGGPPLSPPPPPSADALQTLYEASAWHLLELLCLDPSTSSEGFFAEAFAQWFARHGPLLSTRPGAGWDPLLSARLRLASSARPDADPAFWPLAARLAALGRLGEAAEVLLSHPAYGAPGQHAATVALLEKVYALLRRTPRLVAPSAAASMGGGGRGGGGGGGGGGGAFSSSSFAPVIDLGRAMDDPASFRRERAEWQAEAAALARRESAALSALGGGGDPDAEKGLRALLAVCSGDEGALRKAAGRNWLEFLVALLVWRYPDLRPRLHLRQLVAHAQAAVGGGAEGLPGEDDDGGEDGGCGGGGDGGGPADAGLLAFFDDLIAAAAELEVQSVVAVCTNSPYCGLWFVAHSYDLLCADPQAARALARPLPAPLGCGQAEAYMLHYVDTLAGQASTWQLAAEYLAWCPAHGADVLEALLERLPFPLAGPGGGGGGAGFGGGGGGQGDDDGRAAHKALALCARHGLSGAAVALCRRLGARCAELGARGAALRWLLRAHDPRGVAALVGPLLETVRRALERRAAECAAGGYALAPLALPELEELAPVLDACLAAGGPAEVAAAAAGGGGGGGATDAAAAAPSAGALAVAASTRPYPELQFLRCFVRLQRAAQMAQQAQAAVDARAAEAAAAADRAAEAAAGSGIGCEAAAAVAAADAAARRLAAAEAQLCAAQGAARAPLLELAVGGLAPAAQGARPPILLPLLLAFGVPLLEARFSPLSADDVGRLLGAGRRAAAGAAGAAAPAPSSVADLQLALTRALARAHVEAGVPPAAALVAAN